MQGPCFSFAYCGVIVPLGRVPVKQDTPSGTLCGDAAISYLRGMIHHSYAVYAYSYATRDAGRCRRRLRL